MDNNIKDIIAKSYNQNANYRNRKEIVDWKLNELQKFSDCIVDMSSAKILDLGAGSGIYAQYLSNRGAKVKCIDLSEAMIQLCLEKHLDAQVMDFYNLKFEDNTFNAIWSMNTLLHVPKVSIVHVLKGVRRVLVEDGIFYLGVYGGRSSEGIYEDDFYTPKRYFSRYEDDEILDILSEHFAILKFNHIDVGVEDYWYQSVIMKNEKVKL